MSSQAVARRVERVRGPNIPKDNWLGFVGDVLKFTGEVTFKSTLRIDGNFCGHVNSRDGTLMKINGTVEGDINASKELILGRTANVTGNVSARALIVEEGALFNGSCRRI